MNTIQMNDMIFHYQKIGTGKPVVLVHGNGEDHRELKNFLCGHILSCKKV